MLKSAPVGSMPGRGAGCVEYFSYYQNGTTSSLQTQ